MCIFCARGALGLAFIWPLLFGCWCCWRCWCCIGLAQDSFLPLFVCLQCCRRGNVILFGLKQQCARKSNNLFGWHYKVVDELKKMDGFWITKNMFNVCILCAVCSYIVFDFIGGFLFCNHFLLFFVIFFGSLLNGNCMALAFELKRCDHFLGFSCVCVCLFSS